MTSAPRPDAGANWVDRHAPERLKPWLKLGRFDRPIGIWLLLLPGWQGIALALAQYRQTPGLYDLWLFVGFGIGACLMRAAGCAFNDIVDRDFDARVARTALRPIPAGLISVKQAWAFVVGCSLISLMILLTLPKVSILLGVGSCALVAAYPFMKRITWWPQAWLGLALYAAHRTRQVLRLDRTDGALALKLFKSNREAGFILRAALALGSLGQNLIGL